MTFHDLGEIRRAAQDAEPGTAVAPGAPPAPSGSDTRKEQG